MRKPVDGSRKKNLTPREANRATRRKIKATNNVVRLDPRLFDLVRHQREPKRNKIGVIRTAKVALVKKQINSDVMETSAIIVATVEKVVASGVLSS